VHDVELMEARPDLNAFFLISFRIPDFDDLRIVLENVRQAGAGEDTLPEVVGLEAIRVGRIARAVVPSEIERPFDPSAFVRFCGYFPSPVDFEAPTSLFPFLTSSFILPT
jgi:hypothetical protein